MVSREHPVHQDLSGHVYTMEENREVEPVRRRRHSAAFKAEAVRACRHPGVSIAAVALHYRLNANLLRRWVADHELEQPDAGIPADQPMPIKQAEFVPLQLNLGDTAAGVILPRFHVQQVMRLSACFQPPSEYGSQSKNEGAVGCKSPQSSPRCRV